VSAASPASSKSSTSKLIEALTAALGLDGVRMGDQIPDRNRNNNSLSGRFAPTTPAALLLPRSTEQVSAALRLCHAHGQPVVTQGGMTGLAGGAHPDAAEIALSLERMSGIEEVDEASATLTALAGTPLQLLHEAADKAGFLYGVDLGARGSCSIGGNVATNAGGNQVLRYGMTRRNVLGLEAVLADGTVLTRLNKMLKNNTGYDWVQLMIGSEGTLGVITRVVVQLYPKPAGVQCALAAVASFDDALKVLRAAESTFPGGLLTFEGMWSEFYKLATGPMGCAPPLSDEHELYLLMETALGPDAGPEKFEEFLAELYEDGLVRDAVVAKSGAERTKIWALRESPYEWSKLPAAITNGFDISVPRNRIGEFVARLRQAMPGRWPTSNWVAFGHIADSNLHVNTRVPPADADEGTREEIDKLVYRLTADLGGSVSAEHGIGRLKRPYLALSRTEPEIQLMRTIKQALDPKGILNPGRIL
jgi:FAD/FMN-containing dehydrogenase